MSEFKVCVTGASGYLGSWIVKMCLEKGWTVAATTRSIERHGDRLRALVPEAVGRLQLFEAQLLDAKTFEAAVTGCDVLLHTASPFFGGGESTYDDFVGPAVQGTEGVLRLAKQLNVTKVVVTSSCASIMGGHCDPPPPIFTEDIWSDIEHMTKIGSNYSISKTLAERKAWELATELGIQVAVMNPGYIFGPVLQPSINTSTGVLYKYIVGKNTEITNASVNFADVRDVAQAHINAADPEAKYSAWGKRHIMCVDYHYRDMVPVLKSALPANLQDRVTQAVASGDPAPVKLWSQTNAEALLGHPLRPMADTMRDTVASLITLNLIEE